MPVLGVVLDPNPEVRYVAVLRAVDRMWYVELGTHPKRDLAQVVVHGPFLRKRIALIYARLQVEARMKGRRLPRFRLRLFVSQPGIEIPVPTTIQTPDWPARDV